MPYLEASREDDLNSQTQVLAQVIAQVHQAYLKLAGRYLQPALTKGLRVPPSLPVARESERKAEQCKLEEDVVQLWRRFYPNLRRTAVNEDGSLGFSKHSATGLQLKNILYR